MRERQVGVRRRLLLLALVCGCVLSAQTLEQAKDLWRQRDMQGALNTFRALIDQNPDRLDYKVLYGRMLMDHGTQQDLTEASGLFNEVLAVKKDDATAIVALALMAADNFEGGAEKLARRALEADPKNLEAQELVARLALEDNNNAKAAAEANKALEMDPNSAVAKGVLASIDWLADKKESQWDPRSARGYATVGHFFTINRRYEEGIQYYRKALELDPELYSARSALGITLMRLGLNDEAFAQLKNCFDHQYASTATTNTMTLMDSYKKFVSSSTGITSLKLGMKEADLLRPYVQAEMDRAIATYEKKYKLKLEQPVRVEVYPDHEDFAVRALGMPGLGALGVTFTSKSFGSAIAMDSPSGRKPGDFHWASTLWHEMSHVFTLTITNSHVPRWFTEGLAVHEETAASPEWGDRLNPDVLMAIKNKQLLPITDLDRGFIHPTAPMQIIVSYYQAGRICDFINDKWGWDTLLAMLRDFSVQTDTASVIRKELKIEPADFDKQFLAMVDAETKKTVEHFNEWKEDLKQIAAAAGKKDNDTVIKLGTAARDLFPDFVEAGSVYEFLAKAYVAKENKPAATAELERYVKAGGRNPQSIKLLAQQLDDAGNKKEAAAVLDRLNYIYPVDDDLHKKLGALWFDLKNSAGAIREFQAVVSHNPADPAQAHYDLARAYHQNHQDELAKEESIDALETAPGFRAAQKLLLELSGGGEQTPAAPVKKRE